MTAMAVDSGDHVMPAAAPPLVTAARAVAAAYVLAALLLAGGLVLVGRAEWWRGFAAATIATLMACVATVPVIAWGLRVARARPDFAAAAFLTSAGVRAAVALGGAMIAVRVGGYPKAQTLLLVVPYYFALLAAETLVLVRLLWKSGPSAGSSSPSSPTKTTEANHD